MEKSVHVGWHVDGGAPQTNLIVNGWLSIMLLWDNICAV